MEKGVVCGNFRCACRGGFCQRLHCNGIFSYNREPLPDEVYTEYTAEDFSFHDAVSLATALVQEANDAYRNTRHDENGNIVYPYTFSEMSDKIAEEYAKLQSDYFSPYTPKAKR